MSATQAPPKWRVSLALITAVAAISFAAIFFKSAQPTHPLVMSGVRLSIASLLLLPFSLHAMRSGALTRRAFYGGLIAGLLYALHFGAWVWSLTLTSVAASVTLVTATPLMLAIGSLITGKDRPTKRIWASLGLASLGIALVGWADLSLSAQALIGDLLALLGAAAIAAYFVLVRKLGAQLPTVAFAGIACAGGATCLLLVATLVGLPWQVASAESGLYLLLAALIPQLIGHNLLTWSLRHVTPTMAGVATLAEPVGSTFLGVWLLSEHPAALVYFGCALTLVAVGIALGARTSKSPRHLPDATHDVPSPDAP